MKKLGLIIVLTLFYNINSYSQYLGIHAGYYSMSKSIKDLDYKYRANTFDTGFYYFHHINDFFGIDIRYGISYAKYKKYNKTIEYFNPGPASYKISVTEKALLSTLSLGFNYMFNLGRLVKKPPNVIPKKAYKIVLPYLGAGFAAFMLHQIKDIELVSGTPKYPLNTKSKSPAAWGLRFNGGVQLFIKDRILVDCNFAYIFLIPYSDSIKIKYPNHFISFNIALGIKVGELKKISSSGGVPILELDG